MDTSNIQNMVNNIQLYEERNGKLYSLSYSVFNNKFWVFIKEHDAKDIRKNKIVFKFVLTTFNIRYLLLMLKKVSRFKENDKLEIEVYGPKWVNNKMVEGEKVLNAIVILTKMINKKHNSLHNVLAIKTPDGYVYPFSFLPTPYMKVRFNGQEKSIQELSNDQCETYAMLLEQFLSQLPEAYGNKVLETKSNNNNNNTSNTTSESANLNDII